MATVTGFTAARSLAIENGTIVSGTIQGDNLILTKKDGTTVNAGIVRGATGATGATGPTGATGAQGSAGTSILSGNINPTSSVGNNGDFYINTQTTTLFGPKAGGVWPSGVSLTGGTSGIPTGGTTGQVLAKIDSTNYNTQWVTPSATSDLSSSFPVTLGFALSDEGTAITTGTKLKIRSPFAFTASEVRISVTTADTSAIMTVNILNGAGSTIFTTKPTIDANEKTSTTAAVGSVLSVTSIAADEELTFNVDATGTVARGLKVWIFGTRSLGAIQTTVPGTPTLSGTIGNAQVTLNWVPPISGGGSPITGYLVQGSINGGVTWSTILSSATGTSATVTTYDGTTTLVNGTSYVFRVSAINAIGTGSPSNTTTLVPATTPSTPNAPTATTGPSSASLSWTAPTSNGSTITDYTVQYSSNSGSTWTTFSRSASTATSATVTGLTNGTAYTFRVAAVNAVGSSSFSSASNSVTPSGSNGTYFFSPSLTVSNGFNAYSFSSWNNAANGITTDPDTTVTTTTGGYVSVGRSPGGKGSTVRGVSEPIFEFDTSSIPDTAIISNAIFKLYWTSTSNVTNVNLELYAYDWGNTVDQVDYRGQTWLQSATLIASLPNPHLLSGVGLKTFTSSGANLINAINKTGATRLVLTTDFHRTNTNDTQNFEHTTYFTKANCVLEVTF